MTIPRRLKAMNAGAVLALTIASESIPAQQVPANAPQLPRFERGTCPVEPHNLRPGVELVCGDLVVPENRQRPNGTTIRLAVAILRAPAGAKLPPLVMLHGGPGKSGIQILPAAAAQPWPRDVVIYDQRGAGFSRPAPCPDFGSQKLAARQTESSARRIERRIRTAVSECLASMRAQDIDPAAYTTAESAEDLADLRKALGYSTWDVYGVSYGTRLALAALATDRSGIRSVVLDHPMKPGPHMADRTRRTQNSLERVFAACAADVTCHAAFSHPDRDLDVLFRDLAATPLRVRRSDSPGDDEALVLDGRRLVLAVEEGLHSAKQVPWIPFLLGELRDGDRLRASRELVGWLEGQDNPRAITNLVNCNDEYGPGERAVEQRTLTSVSKPIRSVAHDSALRTCDLWTKRFDDTPTPFAAADVPVLILTAEFDPATPPEDGRDIAAMLPNAHHYELRGESHAGAPAGCRRSIIGQFFDDPSREPDVSCIAAMPRVQFVTGWPERGAHRR